MVCAHALNFFEIAGLHVLIKASRTLRVCCIAALPYIRLNLISSFRRVAPAYKSSSPSTCHVIHSCMVWTGNSTWECSSYKYSAAFWSNFNGLTWEECIDRCGKMSMESTSIVTDASLVLFQEEAASKKNMKVATTYYPHIHLFEKTERWGAWVRWAACQCPTYSWIAGFITPRFSMLSFSCCRK